MSITATVRIVEEVEEGDRLIGSDIAAEVRFVSTSSGRCERKNRRRLVNLQDQGVARFLQQNG